MGELFDNDFGKDESPADDTKIAQVILYFSAEEAIEFKKLCRKGIKKMYGSEANEKGNISDFLLAQQRQANAEVNS